MVITLNAEQVQALVAVLDYVERWNKCDEDRVAAHAQHELEAMLDAQGISSLNGQPVHPAIAPSAEAVNNLIALATGR